MKRNGVNHPKTCMLAELLGVTLAQAVGHLEMLWHFAAAYAPDGAFRGLSRALLAKRAGWEKDPDVFIDALVDAKGMGRHGFLEEHPELGLVVHDWSEHADDTVQKWLAARNATFWDGRKPYSRRKNSTPYGNACVPPSDHSRKGREGFANDSPLPEPQPEPDPEPEPRSKECAPNTREHLAPSSFDNSTEGDLSAEEILRCWNGMAGRSGLRAVQKMTVSRKAALSERASDPAWRARWREGIDRIPYCPFLLGNSQRGWKASLDWFLKEDSLMRILEGAYDGKPNPDRSCRINYREGHPYVRR